MKEAGWVNVNRIQLHVEKGVVGVHYTALVCVCKAARGV